MRFSLAPLLLLAALGACTTASPNYPSLALRDAERATGTFQPVPAVPYVPPPTPAAVLGRLEQLAAQATSAHRAFQVDTPGVRTLVGAARGTEPGSEAWARAQVALAGLEADRSQAMIALADLDRLMVDATLEGAELERIVAVRDGVIAQIEAQDQVIGALLAELR
jgi:hypothetical protein